MRIDDSYSRISIGRKLVIPDILSDPELLLLKNNIFIYNNILWSPTIISIDKFLPVYQRYIDWNGFISNSLIDNIVQKSEVIELRLGGGDNYFLPHIPIIIIIVIIIIRFLHLLYLEGLQEQLTNIL